ncbi:MAG: transglycosylase SLT domain-containing protein [Rhodospirillaceae bacterium]|nr:transglycosylase SLT domain-containing protein [Rhodospirillaceae bacterium]
MTPFVTVTSGAGQDLSVRSDVLSGIRQASLSTGIEFSYLMAQANRESSFNPSAQAKTSSAAGLYQFVEQTWLGVVKNHGAEYGQGDLADKITRRSDGHFTVADAATRQDILDLRRDPTFAAAMAAEHAADNKAKLSEKLGRDITGTDLYFAHFLGISGAIKFMRNVAESPEKTGASLFPKAAAANKNVFYDESGRAKTVSEIYDKFAATMNADMEAYAAFEGNTAPATIVADAGTALPASPNAAYAMAVRTASLENAPVPGGSSGGFGKVGSLLSPLMLVTLAALPVAREEEENGDKPRRLAMHPPIDGTEFGQPARSGVCSIA